MLAISNMMLAHATSDVNSNDLYEHSIDNPMLCVTRLFIITCNTKAFKQIVEGLIDLTNLC